MVVLIFHYTVGGGGGVCTVVAVAMVFGLKVSVIPAIIINGFHFTSAHRITGMMVSLFLFFFCPFLVDKILQKRRMSGEFNIKYIFPSQCFFFPPLLKRVIAKSCCLYFRASPGKMSTTEHIIQRYRCTRIPRYNSDNGIIRFHRY